jgi:hypothetical protein
MLEAGDKLAIFPERVSMGLIVNVVAGDNQVFFRESSHEEFLSFPYETLLS